MRLVLILACVVAALSSDPPALAADVPAKPNVIYIIVDDLGIGDIGPYGQKRIRTPALDRMAAEGTKFAQAYCGTSVCAPSRCSLMTGLHMGHAPIRANREIQPEGQMPLPAGTYTLPRLFKEAGYTTGLVGKWGLGIWGSSGDPLKVGFDHTFGYNCQRHAHSYFPTHLYRDGRRFELDGKTYAQDLIAEAALDFVRRSKDRPFFLFYAMTLPHGKYEIDSTAAYDKEDWPRVEKVYASMVSRMDADIGRLMALLKELGIDERTLVIFVSDNGAAEGGSGHRTEFFDSNGPWRGTKRSMYEGGLRVPMIARWPGKVPAGRVAQGPVAAWDVLPTAAELTGTKLPEGVKTDGVSIVSTLLGGEAPKRAAPLYWELHEGRPQQAVLIDGRIKGVKRGPSLPIEVYDLEADPGERNDLAAERPDLVRRVADALVASRTDDPLWPLRDPPGRRPATRPATTRPAAGPRVP